jgi:hypothetical protein
MIDAAGKGLNMFKSLIPQPHGHRERTSSMVAEHDDGLIGIEFLVSPRGDIAHGHEDGFRKVRGTKLPWFPNVQEDRWVRLLALLGKSLGGDLRRKHRLTVSQEAVRIGTVPEERLNASCSRVRESAGEQLAQAIKDASRNGTLKDSEASKQSICRQTLVRKAGRFGTSFDRRR